MCRNLHLAVLKLLPFRQSLPEARSRVEDRRSSPVLLQMEHRDSYVTIIRKTIRISSHQDDAIQIAVRAPSTDAVPALA